MRQPLLRLEPAMPMAVSLLDAASPGAARMPAGLADSRAVDAGEEELNASQLEAADQVAGQFVEAIGGENQNPNDPAYLERWQEAQPSADEQLRLFLGDEAFNQYQIRLAQQHYQESQ
jgi:hypothetical protein